MLDKYRSAVEGALLAFYWKDKKYLKGFAVNKYANPSIIVTKGDNPVPMGAYESSRHDDDTAKDYSLVVYPPEIIAALSDYTRKVVYDLTRMTAPRVRSGLFRFPRKPDWNRITQSQNDELQRLKSKS